MGIGASNGRFSDAMTLPINDWLFHLEGETIPPYCALQFIPFISIGVKHLCISIVFGKTLRSSLSLSSQPTNHRGEGVGLIPITLLVQRLNNRGEV